MLSNPPVLVTTNVSGGAKLLPQNSQILTFGDFDEKWSEQKSDRSHQRLFFCESKRTNSAKGVCFMWHFIQILEKIYDYHNFPFIIVVNLMEF